MRIIITFFIGLAIMFCVASATYGQTEQAIPVKKTVNQATLLGIGSMSLTDTYLSPMKYKGMSLSLLYERLNATSLFKDKIVLQQQFFLQGASTDNPANNSKTYYGNIDYHLHGFYPVFKTKSFRILAGAGADLSIGGTYNIRNGNNPAQLNTSANISASLMAFYKWRLFTLRWQITTPLLGVFFSPEYGQSYYEIFVLENHSGTVHFGTPGNQRGLRNYITVDYPMGKATLRAGYLRNFYRTDVNNLIKSFSSHQFMIGIAFESLSFGKREIDKTDWLKSVYE